MIGHNNKCAGFDSPNPDNILIYPLGTSEIFMSFCYLATWPANPSPNSYETVWLSVKTNA